MTTRKRKGKTKAKADPPPAAKDDNKRLRRRNDNKSKSKIKRDGESGFGLEGMWMKKIAFEWWVQDRARGSDFSVPSDLGRCYAISLRQTDSFG